MLYDTTRSRSGDMSPEIQAKADSLLKEFMAIVDAMTEERCLQKGIARSQLPGSIAVIQDRENLSVLGQMRSEGRGGIYITNPKIALTPQQAIVHAEWEFGFEDPFFIQFPIGVLDQTPEERRPSLEKIAAKHIDSEFDRFVGLLSLMRTRPIFGPPPAAVSMQTALLLMPSAVALQGNLEAISQAAGTKGLLVEVAGDIREGKRAVRESWAAINQAGIIIADLTGADPGVMYCLGVAHTVGKETVLICPQGSNLLKDIPRTHRIEYEESDEGRMKLEEQLLKTLKSMLPPFED
ncbi:MAG: hypothetical protein A4E48_02050 [Methanosaeta sp. PtaU1.Bin060]|jgi:nucleoside 2-deoxyribosyltransferase|nr:MAG: hypothetical protein A4E48_02050 [Methanosaeta sp. PtaU1.Bin060]